MLRRIDQHEFPLPRLATIFMAILRGSPNGEIFGPSEDKILCQGSSKSKDIFMTGRESAV